MMKDMFLPFRSETREPKENCLIKRLPMPCLPWADLSFLPSTIYPQRQFQVQQRECRGGDVISSACFSN